MVFYFFFADIFPVNENAGPETREFLMKVNEILLDYVNACNDRNEKILDFHHPEDMKKLLDLEIAEEPVTLQQLIVDCATTMKYQVKTGEFAKPIISS
jgi:glutamate decarboxylase